MIYTKYVPKNTRKCSKCGVIQDVSEFSIKWKNTCRECRNEHARIYRKENNERVNECGRLRYAKADPLPRKERNKNWAERNVQKRKEYMRQWCMNNKDKQREYGKRQYQKNKQYYNEKSSARKRKINRPDADTVRAMKLIRRMPCGYCGLEGGTIDHIMPISKGGINHWTNMFPACRSCNSSRGNRPFQEVIYG